MSICLCYYYYSDKINSNNTGGSSPTSSSTRTRPSSRFFRTTTCTLAPPCSTPPPPAQLPPPRLPCCDSCILKPLHATADSVLCSLGVALRCLHALTCDGVMRLVTARRSITPSLIFPHWEQVGEGLSNASPLTDSAAICHMPVDLCPPPPPSAPRDASAV